MIMIVTVEQASELIKDGRIVAIPTETVYGLAVDAFNIQAVKRTFEAKGRPADNPLIVHVCHTDQLQLLSDEIPESAKRLADAFWPGPLTLVIDKKSSVPDIVTGGLNSVAVRMPDHKETLELIGKTGPLTAPSANKSGKPSATRAAHIVDDFGESMPVLEGIAPKLGIESTVLDIRDKNPVILRPGFVTAGMILEKTGLTVKQPAGPRYEHSASPGTRYTHYKPAASIQIIDEIPSLFDNLSYYIFHSPAVAAQHPNVHNYEGDYSALARDLYDHFRQADYQNCSQILIEKLPEDEKSSIISALKDRIYRASSL